MYRTLLGALTVLALAGCSASPPMATPLAATQPAAAQSTATTAPTEQSPAPTSESPSAPATAHAAAPTPAAAGAQPRTAAKPVVGQYSENVPPVLLSAGEQARRTVGVGDSLPALELPQAEGGNAKLESLAGKQATVVLFWGADYWMSHTALADLTRDVVGDSKNQGVAVVGVAVGKKPDEIAAELEKAGAKFAQLVDADSKALAQLGDPVAPQIYVLDAAGKIAWFDIEYSEASRRELHATLAALTAATP